MSIKEFGKQQKDKLNKAYTERMLVVCMFAKAMHAIGYDIGLGKDDNEDWDDEWRRVIYVETPKGQLSWHISPHDFHIFKDFPRYTKKWDGTFNGRDPDFAKSLKLPRM